MMTTNPRRVLSISLSGDVYRALYAYADANKITASNAGRVAIHKLLDMPLTTEPARRGFAATRLPLSEITGSPIIQRIEKSAEAKGVPPLVEAVRLLDAAVADKLAARKALEDARTLNGQYEIDVAAARAEQAKAEQERDAAVADAARLREELRLLRAAGTGTADATTAPVRTPSANPLAELDALMSEVQSGD